MKIFFLLPFILLILQSCNDKAVKHKPETSVIQNKERCSFAMSPDLHFKPIDTARFDKESYFNIGSSTSENVMQIFVYNIQIDAAQKVKDQQEALNTPNIFVAETIIPIDKVGNYSGTGVIMDGVYAGGIVKGKIKVFAYSNKQKGFVFICQNVGGSKDDMEDFDRIENTFRLK